MSRDEMAKLLYDVSPNQLESYLIANGWNHDGNLGKLASIWHRPEAISADAEVLVPQLSIAKDFRDRLVDAVLAIAAYENRTPVEVVNATAGHFADYIRVRVFHRDVEAGTIPLNDGVMLNSRARDLMASAALSTMSKRRYFSGARPPEAQDYINSLRLGQTEIGSYIVTVIAPVTPVQSNQDVIPLTPLARVVTANLASGLEALSRAVEKFAQAEDLTVFDEAVSFGASSNMCDALLGLSGEQRTRGFEISIAPSTSEKFCNEAKTFVFDAEKVAYIVAASEYYKDNYVLTGRTISGFVKRLDRPRADEDGTITIEALLGEVEKNITVELGAADYLEAVTAHRAKEIVQCTGDVHVTARTAKLLNPTGFRVLQSGNLF
ncbi:hypothetical protein [Sulfuriferula sp.]|uniref:hypothetical protein n=1 Tax=Sulfuriferula sp. TaxID=2025307 RepID=UPI002730512F|nr:hypothetical protein [Sulfuriferula sp.]MDP2025628.1 hypothetical protein [Sulfuriferula sp.]